MSQEDAAILLRALKDLIVHVDCFGALKRLRGFNDDVDYETLREAARVASLLVDEIENCKEA